jgi:hypothetical protein
MLRRIALLLCLSLLAGPSLADSKNGVMDAREPFSIKLRVEALQTANSLLDEIVSWLASNFDLPTTQDRPNIQFAAKAEMTRMRVADRVHWQGFSQDAEVGQMSDRAVVAIYDTASKTVFLPDGWVGKSPADQSVLVHELVHHLQNMAKLKFECPAAREKAAYLAQDKWLARFGKRLEDEFEVDMFTIVVSSACM